MEDAFSAYHPAVEFFFFAVAIASGMFFVHPLYLAISLCAAVSYYWLLKGRSGLQFLLSLLLLWVLMALLNGALVQEGETVLFTWWRGRTFTKEALLYGLCGGAMFVSILLWFSCYNEVMTSDKFICLFGSRIPALSLLLTMILRLIPNFEHKAKTIAAARKCIGRSPDNGSTRREKLLHSMDLLSVLTSWALEGSVVTADSMKSRGYGCTERTSFTVYRKSGRDGVAAAVLGLALALFLTGIIHGAAKAEFYPAVALAEPDGYTLVSALGYAVFLFTPTFLHLREDVLWTVLRSKI